MNKSTESIQNELIRLLPNEESSKNPAVEVSKVGDVYFVYLVQLDGTVMRSTKCGNLATVFATVTRFLNDRAGVEYVIES